MRKRPSLAIVVAVAVVVVAIGQQREKCVCQCVVVVVEQGLCCRKSVMNSNVSNTVESGFVCVVERASQIKLSPYSESDRSSRHSSFH